MSLGYKYLEICTKKVTWFICGNIKVESNRPMAYIQAAFSIMVAVCWGVGCAQVRKRGSHSRAEPPMPTLSGAQFAKGTSGGLVDRRRSTPVELER